MSVLALTVMVGALGCLDAFAAAPAKLPALSATSTGSWVRVSEASLGPGYMNGIACVSARDCWAVGTGNSGAVIIHWDGSRWQRAVAPGGISGAALQAVSCPGASDCWAAGTYDVGTSARALIEHWNGHVWSRVPSPAPYVSGVAGDNVLGLSCQSAASCWAVGGTLYYGAGQYHMIVLHLTDGHWVNDPVTDHPLAVLSGAWCAAHGICWAVGNGIERYKDHRWNGVPSPALSAASGGKQLQAVACETATRCLAVGEDRNSQYLVRWTGRSWSSLEGATPPLSSCHQTVANPCPQPTVSQQAASFVSELTSIACHQILGCLVVGDRSNGQAWSELWTGTTLTGIPAAKAPATPHGPAVLNAVACPTATQCLAVGSFGGKPPGAGSILFEKFTA